jgi:hypothetical protein
MNVSLCTPTPTYSHTHTHSDDWYTVEAGILVLGAIAEGCYDALSAKEGLLEALLRHLCEVLETSEHVLVKTIACFTIRYV